MERNGIITKVNEPTEWVNGLVVAEKPCTGKLRVCLDPRDLNKAIKRPHYPFPTLDDVTPQLAGAQHFSVMDARSGYWNIKLTRVIPAHDIQHHFRQISLFPSALWNNFCSGHFSEENR